MTALAGAAALWSGSAAAATLVAGDPTDAFDIVEYARGLAEPTDVLVLADGRGVIVQRRGLVTVRRPDGMLVDAGTITVVTSNAELGLLGVIADPNFATNKTLYFYASTGTDPLNRHKVLKIVLNDDNTLAAERPAIVDMGLEGPANHDGGGLVIHKDADGVNRLYIGVGDTGQNATPPRNRYGTCLNKANGKILRVNLDGTIPTDNPLSGVAMVSACDVPVGGALTLAPPDTRIFAWGFRNPYRFFIDEGTHNLWIGDVGEVTAEEVTVGGKGLHHGWPFVEGTTAFTPAQQAFQPTNACMGITPPTACTAPVYAYGHTMGRNCVIGGPIPSGCGWAAPWSNRYIFGDHGSGEIWTLDVNPARDGVVAGSLKPFATTGRDGLGSLRMGADAALYILQDVGGHIERVTPKAAATACGADAGAVRPIDGGRDAVSSGAGGGGGTTSDASTGGASGSTGAGGGAPRSDAAATGGMGGSSGAGAAGSAAETGGAMGGVAGTGGATGGSNASGGPGAEAGTTPDGSDSSSGCSCSTVAGGRTSGLAAWAGLALAGAVLSRRSSRKRGNR